MSGDLTVGPYPKQPLCETIYPQKHLKIKLKWYSNVIRRRPPNNMTRKIFDIISQIRTRGRSLVIWMATFDKELF